MDATTLRELQAPLKARYREDPGAAVVTLTADGELDGTGVACRVRTATALAEAGLHPATEVPVGFREIRLRFDLDTGASEEEVASLIRLTERYCVVLQTLKSSPATSVSVRA
jgi:uncharacterized OsmC-like protein